MAVRVTPTLERMATVYRLSKDGGNRSPRFVGYVDAAKHGAPISGYNPMTSKPVLATIDALIVMRAEARVEAIANETATQLAFLDDVSMHITIAAPGMWTDRLATDVHHRLAANDPRALLWWYDDALSVERLEAEAIAHTVRMVTTLRDGAPASLRAAVAQEGAAGAMSGAAGCFDRGAAEALTVLGGDSSLAAMVAFLYGDAAAVAMGFLPLGLGDRVGYAHAVALAQEHALHA